MIGTILLAAGSSSRLGMNKMAIVHNGKSLLENVTLASVESLSNNVLVVLGAHYNENQMLLKQFKIDRIINKSWKLGIGSSIKAGLNSMLDKYPDLDAVIISVCDQPHISSGVFNQLIKTYRETGKKIIASAYAGNIGVPVLYDKSMFASLLGLPDNAGAKKFILNKTHEEHMATLPFPKGNIDIDTKEDLSQF